MLSQKSMKFRAALMENRSERVAEGVITVLNLNDFSLSIPPKP